MSESVNTRAIVLDILMEINENDAYSHLTINNALKKFQYLEKQDRAFITRLSQGTIEKLIYLDYVIDLYSKVSVKKMKPLIRNLMRMSVYQILFMDNIPDSAVCNEAVKIAVKRKFGTLKGFVNGVLRNIVRNKNDIKEPESLSIKYSMPEWIVSRWENVYGREKLVQMLCAFEQESPTYVMCNTNEKSLAEIVDILKTQGVVVEMVDGIPNALKISGYDYIAGLDAFNQGLINVQDISSMLVGLVVSPEKGSKVIDVCAAPGGKSVHMAIMLEGTGSVDSRDISENKVYQMEETVQRIGLSNMQVNVQDALVLNDADIENADVVLCDLPCSGLGIIGRKSDIKYKMTPEKQEELVKIQREILKVVHRYVKPGGRLVFSTCTINEKENEENVKWIVENLGFKAESLEGVIPERFVVDEETMKTIKKGYIQLLPGVHGTDGFFISRFRKE